MANNLDATRKDEQRQARSALMASLDAELAEWTARLTTALDTAMQQRAAATVAFQAKIADLRARHDEPARKRSHIMKQANMATFGELRRGEL